MMARRSQADGRTRVAAGMVGMAGGARDVRSPIRLPLRAWRRGQARLAAQGAHRGRWRSRGQTLIFFALSVTVLVAILGLAIDTIRIYDLYARMQRAAEAGALAAVLYMPNYYSTDLTTPPADNAICRALEETIKDGFGQPCGSSLSGYCPSDPATVEVAICPVTGKPHDLTVYITESSNVIFLSAVNVGPVTVTVKAQAEYLPPIQIGQDSSDAGAGYFGGYGACDNTNANPSTCANAGPQSFLANINGPAELKEQGDPYVNCEEGPAHVTSIDTGSGFSTYTGYSASANPPGLLTNHQQYSTNYNTILASHCGAFNTDQQPIGFSGPATSATAHPGGYTYLVDVTQAGAGLWVYNASYIPTNGQLPNSASTACTGPQQIDQFAWYRDTASGACAQGYYLNYGVTPFAGNFMDPSFYYNTTYTLYSVPNITALTAGAQVATLVAPPYDGVQADLTAKGCTTGQVIDPQAGACVARPSSEFGWTQIASNLPVGQYRLEVEAKSLNAQAPFTSGWGQHGYGLRLCPSVTSLGSEVSTCDSNAATAPGDISALGATDTTLIFPQIPAVTAFPLAVIPTEYAGRSVQVSLFDPGDPINANPTIPENTAFYIMPPQTNGQANACSVNARSLTGYTYTPPSWEDSRIVSMTSFGLSNTNLALATSRNGDNAFNGIWASVTVTLPPTYTQGQWTLCGYESVANAQDTLAIAIAPLGQSPAHLV